MTKIHFLGTCSGTEPMAGMHHCSLVVEVNGAYYWFDAGENCAHRAYTDGIDVLKTQAIFVSHPHIDHVGGLANLFSCMKKLVTRYKTPMDNNNSMQIFFPDEKLLDAIITVCNGTDPESSLHFDLIRHSVHDGLLFEDKNVRVSAVHNRHLGEDGEAGWHSYSYLRETEGKRIVFSGDVKAYSELDTFVTEGCDLLIGETGHHKVADVCEYVAAKGVKRMYFNHHGREILGDRAAAEGLIAGYETKGNLSIRLCYDGMTEIL